MAEIPMPPEDQQETTLPVEPEQPDIGLPTEISPKQLGATPPVEPEQPAVGLPPGISLEEQAKAILGVTAPTFDIEAQAKAIADIPSPYEDFADQVIQLADDPLGKGILSSLKETITKGDLQGRYGKAYDYFVQAPEFKDSAKQAGEAFEQNDPLGVAKGFLGGLSAMTQGYFNLAIGRTKEDAEAAALSNEAEVLIGKIRDKKQAARAIELGEVYTEKLDRGESIAPEGQKPEFIVKTESSEGYITGVNQGMNLAEGQEYLGELLEDQEPLVSSSAVRVFATTGTNALPFVTSGNIYIEDETDPDQVARRKALVHKINEVIRDKYYGSQIAGSVAGSLGGFVGAGKLATKMLGTPALVGDKMIQVPNSLSRWGTYTLYGGGESLEDVRPLSWDERLLDVAENIGKLGLSERIGETGGTYIERLAAQKLANSAFTASLPKATSALRNAAFIGGGVVSETISNQVDRVLAGEAPLPGLGEDVATAAGAVFGMYLIGKGANLFTKPGIENRVFDMGKKALSDYYGGYIDSVNSDTRLTFNQRRATIENFAKNLSTQEARDLFIARMAEKAAVKNIAAAPQTAKAAKEIVEKLEGPAFAAELKAEADRQEAAKKAKATGEIAPSEPIGTKLVGPALPEKTEEELDSEAEKLNQVAFAALKDDPTKPFNVPRTPANEKLLERLEKAQKISGEKSEDVYTIKAVYNDKRELAGDEKFAPDLLAENAIQAGLATLEDLQKDIPKEKVEQLREDFTEATSEEEAKRITAEFASIETIENSQNEIIMDELELPELTSKNKEILDRLNAQITQLRRDVLTVPTAQKAETEQKLNDSVRQKDELLQETLNIEKLGVSRVSEAIQDAVQRALKLKKFTRDQARQVAENIALSINIDGSPSNLRFKKYLQDPEKNARLSDVNATIEIFGLKNKKKRDQAVNMGTLNEAKEVIKTPKQVLDTYRERKERWLTGDNFKKFPNIQNVVLDAWMDSLQLEILEGKKNLNMDLVFFRKLFEAIRKYEVRRALNEGVEFAESLDAEPSPRLEAGILEEEAPDEAGRVTTATREKLDAEDKQFASDLIEQARKEYQEVSLKGLAEKEPVYQVVFDELVSPREAGTKPDRVAIANKFRISVNEIIQKEIGLRDDFLSFLEKRAEKYKNEKAARAFEARKTLARPERALTGELKARQTQMENAFGLAKKLREEKFFLKVYQKNPDGTIEEVDLDKKIKDLESKLQRSNAKEDLDALVNTLIDIQDRGLRDEVLRSYEQNVRDSLDANKKAGAFPSGLHDEFLRMIDQVSEDYEAVQADFNESKKTPADLIARLTGARKYRLAILDVNDRIGRANNIYGQREPRGASTASPTSGPELARAALNRATSKLDSGGPAGRRGLRRLGSDPYAVTSRDQGPVGRKDPTLSDEAIAEKTGTPLPKITVELPAQAAWVFTDGVRDKLRKATKDSVWDNLDENQKRDYARAMLAGNTKNGAHYNGNGAGEGKSRVELALADAFASSSKPRSVVIITDISTLTPDWRRNDPGGSIGKDAKTMGIQLELRGNAARPLPEKLVPGQILLTTNHYIEQLVPLITPDTVIIWDEFHMMRNLERKKNGTEKEFEKSWAFYAQEILGNAEKVFMFSGTPFEKFDQMVSAFRRLGIFDEKGMTVDTLAKRLGFENKKVRGSREEEMLPAGPNRSILDALKEDEVVKYGEDREKIKKSIERIGSKPKLSDKDIKELAQLTEDLAGIDRIIGVSAVDQRERIKGFLNKLAAANKYSSRSMSMEIEINGKREPGVIFEQVMIPLDEDIKNKLNVAKAQMGGTERIDSNKKNKLETAFRFFLENYKAKPAAFLAKKAIERGENVVIFVEFVKSPKQTSGIFDKPSALLVEEELLKLMPGLKIAKMYDPKISKQSKSDALRSFQSGESRVLIATKETAGTGGELDDKLGPEKGGRPRYLIYLSNPLSAIAFVQSAGRGFRKLTASKLRAALIRTDTDTDNAIEDLRYAKDILLGAALKQVELGPTGEEKPAVKAEPVKEEVVEKPAKRLATIRRPVQKPKVSKEAEAKEFADFKARLNAWIDSNLLETVKNPSPELVKTLGREPIKDIQKIVTKNSRGLFDAFKAKNFPEVRDFLTSINTQFSFGRSVDDVIQNFNDRVYENKPIKQAPKVSEVRVVEEEKIVSDKHEDNYKPQKLTEKQQATLDSAEAEFKNIYKSAYKNGSITYTDRKGKNIYNIQFSFTGGRPYVLPGSSDETDVAVFDPDYVNQLKQESGKDFENRLSKILFEELPFHIGLFRYLRNVVGAEPIQFLTEMYDQYSQDTIEGSAKLYNSWLGRGVYTKKQMQDILSSFASNPILVGAELHRQILGKRIFGDTTEVLLAPNKEAYNRAKARQDALFAEDIRNSPILLGKVKELFRAAETFLASLKGIPKASYIPADLNKSIEQALNEMVRRSKTLIPESKSVKKEKPAKPKTAKQTLKEYHLEFEDNQIELNDIEYRNNLSPGEVDRLNKLKARQDFLYKKIMDLESRAEVSTPPEAGKTNPFPPEEPTRFRLSSLKITRLIDLADEGKIDRLFKTKVQSDIYGKFLPVGELLGWLNYLKATDELHPVEIELLRWGVEQNYDKRNAVYLPQLRQTVLESAEDMEALGKFLPNSIFIPDDQVLPEEAPERLSASIAVNKPGVEELYIVNIKGVVPDTVWAQSPDEATSKFVFRTLPRQSISYGGKTYTGIESGAALVAALSAEDPTYKSFAQVKPYIKMPPSPEEGPRLVASQGGANWLARVLDVIPNDGIRSRLEAHLTYRELTNEETKQRAIDYINEVSKQPDGFSKLVRQFLNDTFPRRTPLVMRTAVGLQIANMLAQDAADGDSNAQELLGDMSMVLQDRHMVDPGRAIQYLFQGPDLAADSISFIKVLDSQLETAAKLRMEPYIPYFEQTTEELAKADLEAGNAFANAPETQDIVSQIQRFEKLKQNASEELAKLNSQLANFVLESENRLNDIFGNVVSPLGLPPSNVSEGDNLGVDQNIVNNLAGYLLDVMRTGYPEAKDIIEKANVKKIVLLSPFFTKAKNPEAKLRVFNHHFESAYANALARFLETQKEDFNITQQEIDDAKQTLKNLKTRGAGKIIADDLDNKTRQKRKTGTVKKEPTSLKELVPDAAKEIVQIGKEQKDKALASNIKRLAKYIKSQSMVGRAKEKGLLTPRKGEKKLTAAENLKELFLAFEEGMEFYQDVGLYIQNNYKPEERGKVFDIFQKVMERPITISTFSRVVSTLESIGGTNKSIQRLIRDPKENITQFKRELQDLLLKGTTMPENLRIKAQDYISKNLEDMITAKRKEALIKLKDKLTKTAEKKTRKVRSAIDKLLDATNLGALNDAEIFQQMRIKLGLPELGDAERKRVNDMVVNLTRFPPGQLRNKKIGEINDYIKLIAPITFSNYAPSYQTNNVLMALGSLGINASSSAFGISFDALQAYGLATMKQAFGGPEQKLQAVAIKAGIKALGNSWFSPEGLARKAGFKIWKTGQIPSDSVIMKELNQFNLFEAMLHEKEATQAGKRGDQVAELTVVLPPGLSPVANFIGKWIPQFVKKSGPVQSLSEVIKREGREVKINLQAEWKPELKFLPESLRTPAMNIVKSFFPTKFIDLPLSLQEIPGVSYLMRKGSPFLSAIPKLPVVGKYLGVLGEVKDLPIYPYNSSTGSYILASRVMAAWDTIAKFGTRKLAELVEAGYLIAKQNPNLTEEEFLEKIAVFRNRTKDSIERAMKLAMSEAMQFSENGEIIMSPEDILLRADEILDQNMPTDEFTKQVLERAKSYAERMSFQQDYEGYIGAIAGSIDAVARHFWVSASIFKFLRTASGLANEFLNYFPGVSVARFYTGMGRLLAHTEATKRFYRPPAPPESFQRDMLRSKMIIGHAATVLIGSLVAAALDDDKENPWFFIHFKGPKEAGRRKSYFSSGGSLKSVQIGKFGEPLMIGGVKVADGPVFISWEALFPGATGFLMPIAAMAEAVRYEKRSFAEAVPTILATGGITVGLGVVDMGLLSGSRSLLQLISPSATAQDTVRNFSTFLGQLVASYVPYYPKLRDYDALYDGITGQPRAKLYKDGFASYFLSNFPIVSRFGNPDLDFLGGQISTDMVNTIPLVKRFFRLALSGDEYDRTDNPTDQQVHDKLMTLFAKHGRRITWDAGTLNDIAQMEMAYQASRGVPIDKSIYQILALTRDLTDDEKYEWIRIAGPIIQQNLKPLIPRLQEAQDAAEFDYILDKESNVAKIKREVLRAILIEKFSQGIMEGQLP